MDRITLILVGIVLVPLIGGFLGLSAAIISKLTELGTSLLSGAVTSNVAGNAVQTATGNSLKTIIFRFVFIVPISISAFSAVTFVVGRLMKSFE